MAEIKCIIVSLQRIMYISSLTQGMHDICYGYFEGENARVASLKKNAFGVEGEKAVR